MGNIFKICINLMMLVLCLTSKINAQDNSEQLYIVGEASKIEGETVENVPENRDVNGVLSAAIYIETKLEGLTFDSNNGIVRSEQVQDGYRIYLSPNERVLTLYKLGYLPFDIILSENGIYLESREVWYLKISGEKSINEPLYIPVKFEVWPSGANLNIKQDSLIIGEKNRELSKGITKDNVSIIEELLPVGEYKLEANKEGYHNETFHIDISESKINEYQFRLYKDRLIDYLTYVDLELGAAFGLAGETGFVMSSIDFQRKERLNFQVLFNYGGTTTNNEDYLEYLLIGIGGSMSKELLPNSIDIFGGASFSVVRNTVGDINPKNKLNLNGYAGLKVRVPEYELLGLYLKINYGMLNLGSSPFIELGNSFRIINHQKKF